MGGMAIRGTGMRGGIPQTGISNFQYSSTTSYVGPEVRSATSAHFHNEFDPSRGGFVTVPNQYPQPSAGPIVDVHEEEEDSYMHHEEIEDDEAMLRRVMQESLASQPHLPVAPASVP